MTCAFNQKLQALWNQNKFVCVGLDPELTRIPACVRTGTAVDSIVRFNCAIVDATRDLVLAYKPNSAFFEAHGADGMDALRVTIAHIRTVAPDVPVILDAKRADIGNTNIGYCTSVFGWFDVDAVTVHPYLGAEALQPFLQAKDKGVIVLCRTSNAGAGEFQDLLVHGEPLYCMVAKRVASDWNVNGNCALVVGATYPNELARVRSLVGDMPILIPAIGAQGGDVEQTVRAGKDSRNAGMIISASRSIIFASSGEDFPAAARYEVDKLTTLINEFR